MWSVRSSVISDSYSWRCSVCLVQMGFIRTSAPEFCLRLPQNRSPVALDHCQSQSLCQTSVKNNYVFRLLISILVQIVQHGFTFEQVYVSLNSAPGNFSSRCNRPFTFWTIIEPETEEHHLRLMNVYHDTTAVSHTTCSLHLEASSRWPFCLRPLDKQTLWL